jgi:broad specificity phosphatase PhoE
MRHGETPWNRQGRVMGRQPVELDAGGRTQVQDAVELARVLQPDLIVTSPLIRARQSAEIIAAGLGGVQVVDEPQIEEVRYGSWEGMTYHQLIEDPAYIDYRKAPLETPMPGGESILDVQKRGVEAVKRQIAANSGKRLLFVSHGDIIRTVLCHFIALDLKYFHRIRVDNATFFGLEISDDFAEVKFLNLLPDPRRAFVAPFKK